MSKDDMQDSDFFDETDDEIQENRYISGLGKIDDQVIILLDMEKLVGQEDMEAVLSGV